MPPFCPLCSCRRSSPYYNCCCFAATWALLPSSSTGCYVRYSLYLKKEMFFSTTVIGVSIWSPLGRVGDCDWCLPVPPLYSMLLPTCSPYCYCCCCRCCVGATPFFLYRLLCPILAACVLLVCYVVAAEVLLFSAIPSPGTTPPYAPRFSDISSSFRQTPDCSDILTFWAQDDKNWCGGFFAVLLGLTSCNLKKNMGKEKNRSSLHCPFENRAKMDSASSAESLPGLVLEVLRTRAVYQCSTPLTMRVLAVLPLILRCSQVCRSSLLWILYDPYLQ